MKVPVNKLKEEVEMMKRNHKSGNITGVIIIIMRSSPEIKESHEIAVLAMNVTEDFDWRR